MAGETVECPACGQSNQVPRVHAAVPQCASCQKALPWVVDAVDADFAEVADAATVPVLVDVWAPWCRPCKRLTPLIERAAQDLAGRVKVVKVNSDEAPSLTARFGIRGVPTLLLLDRGAVVERRVGGMPDHELRSWLEESLAKTAA